MLWLDWNLSGVKDKKKLDHIAEESLKKAALWDEVKNGP